MEEVARQPKARSGRALNRDISYDRDTGIPRKHTTEALSSLLSEYPTEIKGTLP